VTRVIGGQARGRRLQVPGRGTRPTADRTREALFNSLGALLEIPGCAVLDLYAGSGAVGLEALSRGAASAVLVESDPAAAATIAANVAALGLPGARLVRRTVERYLVEPPDEPFDVVFIDPPYAVADEALAAVLARLGDPTWLHSGAIVVVERSVRSAAPTWPESLRDLQYKRYGDTALWYRRAA
jgi:16S rRNA (guanine966-N2)-methyltransferase